jgi:hypothetical protein
MPDRQRCSRTTRRDGSPSTSHGCRSCSGSRIDSGRTYDRSVKIGDPGGATEDNPKPTRPFVDPDPKSIHDFGDPLNQRGPD